MSREKLYAERDPDEIEPYRIRHVMAMTAEGLHSKSDIADELAYRDKVIAAQADELTAANQRIAELEKDADILQTNLDAALAQAKQFKSLIADIASTGFLTPGFESSVTHRDICKQYKALKGAAE